MNGAESLVRTLVNSGVEVCFSNPGTSEMHLVAALDATPQIRPVLCLFEGVATGAADGFGRMTGNPALTLLHLGPGLGNGLANLHNAKKANTPVVNIVGEHATWHIQHDAPLTSDIEGIARPVSHWVRSSPDAKGVAQDAAEALGITAHRLKALGMVDKIVNEPVGGAHRDPRQMSAFLKRGLADAWRQISDLKPRELLDRRYERLMSYGRFNDTKAER